MGLPSKPQKGKPLDKQGDNLDKEVEAQYVKLFSDFPNSQDIKNMANKLAMSATVSASGTVATNINPALTEIHQSGLFPNPINPSEEFGVTREFADKFNRAIDVINPETAQKNYSPTEVTPTIRNNKVAVRLRQREQITNADDFYKAFRQLTSPKAIQTTLALWHYATSKGSFYFNGVRLSKIMETVLENKTGYFTQEQKREFTKAIHTIRDFEIELDKPVKDKDDKGRKRKMIKREYVRLLDITGAVYAKNRDGKVDDSVIVKLYGELLPNFNKGAIRARAYPKQILTLDANKDSTAIKLGYRFLTRFSQLQTDQRDKEVVIKLKRKTLIEWANYQQTDKRDKWTASNILTKSINKLVEKKIIKSFSPNPIPTDDDAVICFCPYPSTECKLKAVKKEERKAIEDRVKELEETNKYYGVEIPKKGKN